MQPTEQPTVHPTITRITPPDVSGLVRRARRLADLSQRDLAERVGIAQPRVARIEAGRPVDVETLARILAAAGLRVAVVDEAGTEVRPMPDDVMRDAGGRRQPAHLDVHTAPEHPTPDMLAHYRESQPRVSWHFRRFERDRRRRVSGAAATADQPTQSTVAEWKREQQRRHLAAAKVQARRELELDDYPDDIHIDPRERVRPS